MIYLKGSIRYRHKQKVTNLGSRKSHLPKSDYDGVYNWPQNILQWGRGSERPATHTQQKWTQIPPRGGQGGGCVLLEGKIRTRPISSHLDRASLVNKGFIIWNKSNIFLEASAWVANHTGFGSSCLLKS